jgi:hypothetical protein
MTLAPALVVTSAFALAALPWPIAGTALGTAALVAVALLQPSRIAASKGFFRYPQYQPLLAGARAAAKRTPAVREMHAAFEIHETTDVGYMYRILGGRIAPDGPFDAIIQPDGSVSLTPVSRP